CQATTANQSVTTIITTSMASAVRITKGNIAAQITVKIGKNSKYRTGNSHSNAKASSNCSANSGEPKRQRKAKSPCSRVSTTNKPPYSRNNRCTGHWLVPG